LPIVFLLKINILRVYHPFAEVHVCISATPGDPNPNSQDPSVKLWLAPTTKKAEPSVLQPGDKLPDENRMEPPTPLGKDKPVLSYWYVTLDAIPNLV